MATNTTIALPPSLKERLREHKYDARCETFAEAIEDLLEQRDGATEAPAR